MPSGDRVQLHAINIPGREGPGSRAEGSRGRDGIEVHEIPIAQVGDTVGRHGGGRVLELVGPGSRNSDIEGRPITDPRHLVPALETIGVTGSKSCALDDIAVPDDRAHLDGDLVGRCRRGEIEGSCAKRQGKVGQGIVQLKAEKPRPPRGSGKLEEERTARGGGGKGTDGPRGRCDPRPFQPVKDLVLGGTQQGRPSLREVRGRDVQLGDPDRGHGLASAAAAVERAQARQQGKKDKVGSLGH